LQGSGVTDRRILYAAAFVRALAVGVTGVLMALYLSELNLSPAKIGLVISAGLGGGAVATWVAMLRADQLGRRRFLMVLALFGTLGGVLFALSPAALLVLLTTAFLGMVNGMGRDRAAALVVEQAALPSTVSDQQRTRAFAWYNVLQDSGHALGALLAGIPTLLQSQAGLDTQLSMRLVLGLCAALILSTLILYSRLSPGVEVKTRSKPARVTRRTRRVLLGISSLFALDSLGGGFLTTALLAYFFFERFGVGVASIALLFFGARLLNAVSHLGAAWLAKRIGLVNTMVFTHIPSSLLLVAVAFAPSFYLAAFLFWFREALVEMDVPTRQSYVMAVVGPEERTFASGITQLVRLGAWSIAPSIAGFLMAGTSLAAPLFAGAGVKIAYDVWLYFAFRGLKPPEEIDRPGELQKRELE
jgi:MFS family permease